MKLQAHHWEMLVLHTTDRPTQLLSEQPTAGRAPLPQPQYEPEPPSGPFAIRCLHHQREIALRGIPVFCSACRASRDWLLINQGREVWVRCRCGNEWAEPEVTRADFDILVHTPERIHFPNLEDAVKAYGFDGTLAGILL